MDEDRLREIVADARGKARLLPPTSYTRAAADHLWLRGLADLEATAFLFPPLLLHLHRHTEAELLALEADIRLVASVAPRKKQVANFLKRGRTVEMVDTRQWYEGRAELALQAQLLERYGQDQVSTDPLLPNAKRADVVFPVGSRRLWVECTSLSDANHHQNAYDPSALVGGMVDPVSETRRLLMKIFDKLVGAPSSTAQLVVRGQMHPNEPSVLLLVDGQWMTPGFTAMGAPWAVLAVTSPTGVAPGIVGLMNEWLVWRYRAAAATAAAALRTVSAVVIAPYGLEQCTVFPNRGADLAHQLTDEEIESLHSDLAIVRAWL
jgi:hypothetical protein